MLFDLASGDFVGTGHAVSRLAIAGSDRELSWGGFREAVARWVAGARTLGIGPDVQLVIHGHKEAEFLVAVTGCLSLHAPFVPVDSIYPEERLRRIAALARAPAIYHAASAEFH